MAYAAVILGLIVIVAALAYLLYDARKTEKLRKNKRK